MYLALFVGFIFYLLPVSFSQSSPRDDGPCLIGCPRVRDLYVNRSTALGDTPLSSPHADPMQSLYSASGNFIQALRSGSVYLAGWLTVGKSPKVC